MSTLGGARCVRSLQRVVCSTLELLRATLQCYSALDT